MSKFIHSDFLDTESYDKNNILKNIIDRNEELQRLRANIKGLSNNESRKSNSNMRFTHWGSQREYDYGARISDKFKDFTFQSSNENKGNLSSKLLIINW